MSYRNYCKFNVLLNLTFSLFGDKETETKSRDRQRDKETERDKERQRQRPRDKERQRDRQGETDRKRQREVICKKASMLRAQVVESLVIVRFCVTRCAMLKLSIINYFCI